METNNEKKKKKPIGGTLPFTFTFPYIVNLQVHHFTQLHLTCFALS